MYIFLFSRRRRLLFCYFLYCQKVRMEYPVFFFGWYTTLRAFYINIVKETTYYRKKVASAKNFRVELQTGIKILIPLIFTHSKLQIKILYCWRALNN